MSRVTVTVFYICNLNTVQKLSQRVLQHIALIFVGQNSLYNNNFDSSCQTVCGACAWNHVFSARLFLRDHFGATYFVAGPFLHRSFRRQFGAL